MAKRAAVHKKIEVVGTSGKSFADAARTAVAKAAESVRGLEWFEVTELRGRIDGAEIDEFQVTLKIGFKLE
jgi:flavin-binding protein dodecin